jgi:molybdate transport system substrate-binding protein
MVGYGAEPVIGPRFARTRWRLTHPTAPPLNRSDAISQPACPDRSSVLRLLDRTGELMAFLRAGLTFLLLVQTTAVSRAAQIVFFCTDALASSARELIPPFETASGHRVTITVANAGTIAARLQNGEPADLGIVLPPAWDRLRQDGRIDPAVRVVLGKVGLGVFVKRGAGKPDISTVDAFKRTIVNARSLAVRDPAQRSPVGAYMLALFDRLMLSEIIKPKLMLTARPPYDEVGKGEAELGFSTLAEIAAERRAELVGPLPADIQTYNVFTTAVPVGSGQRAATADLVRFLTSESSKAVLRAKGIDVD